MRKIEFRGLVVDEPNTWVYGYLIRDDAIYQTTEPKKGCCGIGTFTIIPESVGQYTGCRDVNGIKIFENDIVKENYGGRYFQVVYEEHGFELSPLLGDFHYYEGKLFNPHRLQVVGNSYMTKEGERKIYERENKQKSSKNIFKRFFTAIRNVL